jgi:signal transduction histidine kinase
VLCAGVLAVRPVGSPMGLITSPGPAGVVLRRLVPAAVVFMMVAGGLRLWGQQAGRFGTKLGVALLVFSSVIVLSLLIWRSARRLDLADRRRRIVEARLEVANRVKNEFLLRMSHEVRTPLNAILGFGQLMEMDDPAPHHQEHLRQIMGAGRQLLELVNDVLDLARIETGRLGVTLEPVALGEVVEESVELVRPQANGRGIELSVDLDGADGYVTGDRERLKQVFVYLLDNAIRYNRPEGKVTLMYRATGGRVRVEVADTGPGIPSDLRDRLFIPFDRLGAEETAVEGTGLGLALSKVLMEAMGGAIGVHSQEGSGSTFWVELPPATRPFTPHIATTVAEEPAPRPGSPWTVLYVEDNEADFRLVERILARRPEIELLWAPEGRRGLEMARRHRPDLILLDVHLPDIDGGEVLRRIQDDPSLRNIPVLMLSADVVVEHVERLLAAGARAYLTKPLDFRKLLKVLDQVGQPSPR